MTSPQAYAAQTELPAQAPTLNHVQQPQLWNLDAQGDIILRVGATLKIKARVSAEYSGEVSKVFDRMFNGNFSEGQADRSPEKPFEKALPDDNEEAIMSLPALLYHVQPSFSMHSHKISDLCRSVKTVEKYDCMGNFLL